MPYLFKTLSNGKEVGISNCELILPEGSIADLSDGEIARLVRDLIADLDYLKDYLARGDIGVGTIADARRAVDLERMRNRTRVVKRELTRQRRVEYTSRRKELMLMLIHRDGYVCSHEGCESQEDLTIDHIIPVSKGGSDDLANLRLLCRRHNSSKGDREI